MGFITSPLEFSDMGGSDSDGSPMPPTKPIEDNPLGLEIQLSNEPKLDCDTGISSVTVKQTSGGKDRKVRAKSIRSA